MCGGLLELRTDVSQSVYPGDMARYEAGRRKAYRTDVSDEEWALLDSILTGWREERHFIKEATTPLREIVNAILYQNRTGCQWDLLPHDFPPPSTVYDYFCAWRDDGTDKKIHDLLRRRTRKAAGRAEEPTAMCIDSQSVDSAFTASGDSVGFDGNKKRFGRKRHAAVDTLGLLLDIHVTEANRHDVRGGEHLLDAVHAAVPSVRKAWADQAYVSLPAYAADLDMDVEIVAKVAGTGEFTPVPQRWKSERGFGWFSRSRRLSQDYETRTASSESQIRWTMIGIMLRRLTGRSPKTRYRTSANTPHPTPA
jgi:transposase